jgi:hypothetical protein
VCFTFFSFSLFWSLLLFLCCTNSRVFASLTLCFAQEHTILPTNCTKSLNLQLHTMMENYSNENFNDENQHDVNNENQHDVNNQLLTSIVWRQRPTTLDEMSSMISSGHNTLLSYKVQKGIQPNTTECTCTWEDQMRACFVLKNDPQRPFPTCSSVVVAVSVFHINEDALSFGKSKYSQYRQMQHELEKKMRQVTKENFIDFRHIKRDLRLLTRCCVWLTQRYVCSQQFNVSKKCILKSGIQL